MLLTPDLMRLLLLMCWIGMVILAVFYLRNRRLTFFAYLGWGLFIILVPFLGPFLVILLHPGKSLVHRLHRKHRAFIQLPRLHFS